MSHARSSKPVLLAKILVNSSKVLLMTLFMLVLTYTTVTLGYPGASFFFGVVTLVLAIILYRKISNEWVRAKFGEYRIGI